MTWPSVINLVYPNNASPDTNAHADLKVDWKALKAVRAYADQHKYRPETDMIIVTYVGLFEAYLDLDLRVNPTVPNDILRGFGPAGLGAPAQLVIKTAKDVTIAHASKPVNGIRQN